MSEKDVREDIQELKTDVKEILNILNPPGKLGMAGKVQIMWNGVIFVIGSVVVAIVSTAKLFMGDK